MQLRHEKIDARNDPELFFNQLGKFALLIATTDSFSGVNMDIGVSLIHAALMNGTCALYVDDEGKPVAGLIWAHLDAESTAFYQTHGVLPNLAAWRSGPDLWFLNIIAKGGVIRRIFHDMKQTLFQDHDEAFMIRPARDGTRRIVRFTHFGTSVVRKLPKADQGNAPARH